MSLRPRMAGFTLLELIVAAAILALIAVFSWRGLDALVREREAIAASQATIDVLQRSFARIERDALDAADVEVGDGPGAMLRFVAGAASVDGTPAASVEYRLVDGTLTRSVGGVDRAPLVMLDHVASLSMEAWQPSPKGGVWVRTRGPAPAAPGPATPPSTANGPAPGQPTDAQTPPGTGLPNTANSAANTTQPAVAAGPVATGARFTLVGTDGLQVVRSFMVGGG